MIEIVQYNRFYRKQTNSDLLVNDEVMMIIMKYMRIVMIMIMMPLMQ